MDLQGYLRAIRKGWWIVVLCVVLGAGAASLYIVRATPVYAAKMTFYVSSPTSGPNSAQTLDQALQDRATAYASIASSGRLAEMVVKSEHLSLPASEVAGKVSGAAQLNTPIFEVTVQDTVPARALAIATGIQSDFPVLAGELDNGTSTSAKTTLEVLSAPSVGSTPVSPRKTLDILAGVAGGLIVGLLLAVLREVLDTAIRTTETLAELTDRPVLGQISFDSDARKSPLFIDEQHGQRRSEEFRQLRTNISFLHAADPVSVVVVTSSVDVEGKSTTAANLAVVCAETESRVLLIEGDLRRPSVSAYLGLERASGLTNVLAGQVEVDDVLQTWGRDRLTVLASGPVPPNPSELLGGKRMSDLIEVLRTRFDMIIIDTPPLLPVTDAAVVSRNADGVLIVVRHGKTKRNQLLQALRDLLTVDVRVLGTVLNMRPVRGVDSAYQSTSYYTSLDKLPDGEPLGPSRTREPAEEEEPTVAAPTNPAESFEPANKADPSVAARDTPPRVNGSHVRGMEAQNAGTELSDEEQRQRL